MASDVLIANRALTKLGQARIADLKDPSKAASTLDSMYETVRDAELRSHVWHFSKGRAVLPALSSAPLFGFQYQYPLPSDSLRLLQLGDIPLRPLWRYEELYSIEGKAILTNLSAPLRIRYIKRITDPNLFDATFIEAFACRLAVEACETLTQSAAKLQAVMNLYQQAIRDAIRVNAIERPTQAIDDDTWLISRR